MLGNVLPFEELFDKLEDNLLFCEFKTLGYARTFRELFDILEDTLAFLKLFQIS